MKMRKWAFFLSLILVLEACGDSNKPAEYSAQEVASDLASLQKISDESITMKANAANITIDAALRSVDRWITTLQRYEEKYSRSHRIRTAGAEKIEDPSVRFAIQKEGGKTRRLLNSDRAKLRAQIRELQSWKLRFENLKRKYGAKTTLGELANGGPNIQRLDRIETATIPYLAPTARPKEVGRMLPPGTGIVSGFTIAPNRKDIIPNALVYIPADETNADQKESHLALSSSQDKINACGEPSEAYLAKTCSDEFGYFEFVGVSPGHVEMVFQLGHANRRMFASVNENGKRQLPSKDTALPHLDFLDASLGLAPRVAIVSQNERENANFVREILMPSQDYSPGEFAGLMQDEAKKYDVIVVGNNALASDLFADPNFRSNVDRFVKEGGSLLVLGNAFGLVEQISPKQFDFLSEKPGEVNPMDSASLGAIEAKAKVIGTVAEKSMLAWLEKSKCWDEKAKANSADCISKEGKISLAEVPYGGNLIQAVTAENYPTIWLNWNDSKNSTQPLAVSFDHGKGKVIYSVVHGNSNLSDDALSPEDRVLQYLLLEALR